MNYVDETVVKKYLQPYLKAIHDSAWDDNRFAKTLKQLVRYCLDIHIKHILNGDDRVRYSVDVLEKIKSEEANMLTSDLKVSSLSGLGLANRVNV